MNRCGLSLASSVCSCSGLTLFSNSIYRASSSFFSLREEIEFAFNLIEINKIKISPLFSINIKKKIDDSDPLYNEQIMAPLISIDLIENAFKHADLQSPDAFISVTIEFKNGKLSVFVSNKISEKSVFLKEHSGIGAATLEQRLRIIYKSAFKLERYTEENMYIAKLKIDLLEYKNQMLTS